MEQQFKIPEIKEITSFLEEYGWSYREQEIEGKTVILSNYVLANEDKGILLSFGIEGEFVLVSTVDFLKNVPSKYAQQFLKMNDTLKLVKLYDISSKESDLIHAELGFELWAESWNKYTFFVFLDMLCFGIESVLKKVNEENITHETSFITYDL